jgi:hypothetical protein
MYQLQLNFVREFERMCELKELKAVALTIAHFIPSFMMSDLWLGAILESKRVFRPDSVDQIEH